MPARAVVFAYHDVGARCLSVLLAHGVDVALVVTHRDDPREFIWFASVEKLARAHGLDVVTPDDPNGSEMLARVSSLAPDFLFSFYYRHMLSPALLASAKRGAFNVHGSLLPHYRGRVPVNWAILRGERETGATLHEMVDKPDAGRIVDQMAVPILPDDLAVEVFRKVTVAAELVLHRSLPKLIDGSAALTPQNLALGSYFGGRRPEDGRIPWRQTARAIHNLVRAVAPPYPGAFTDVAGSRLRILRTRIIDDEATAAPARLSLDDAGRLVARCGGGGLLQLLDCELEGRALRAADFTARFGDAPLSLGEAP